MTSQAVKLASTIIAHLKASGELSLLPEVVSVLMSSSEYARAQNKVVVTSAAKLSATELKAIEKYVVSQVGKAYSLENAVDPELVAGFTLQINDTLIDASLLGKITAIQNTLHTKE